MPDDLSTKTALVYDSGLYTWVASKLAEQFGRVLYYTPADADVFPASRKMSWGEGLPGVERVDDFDDHVEESDLIVFPDCGKGGLVARLRREGYRVWGAGLAEVLELDRIALLDVMKGLKLALPDFWILTGVDELQAHLQDPDNENQYVQVSETRGDFETHHHLDWFRSAGWFDELVSTLDRPTRQSKVFLVKGAIDDAVESGIDDINIAGQWCPVAGYGYERKDKAYLGVVVPRAQLPKSLSAIHDAMGPFLKEFDCRGLVQSEMRVKADGTAVLLDLATRQGSPPSEALFERYTNWPEIIWAGAKGEVVTPQLREDAADDAPAYYAEIILKSPVAERRSVALRFPDESRQFVKLHGHCIIDDVDYAPSLEMDIIGAAVGIGDTQDAAMAMAIEVAESVEGEGVHFDAAAFEPLLMQIEQGRGRGIPWPESEAG